MALIFRCAHPVLAFKSFYFRSIRSCPRCTTSFSVLLCQFVSIRIRILSRNWYYKGCNLILLWRAIIRIGTDRLSLANNDSLLWLAIIRKWRKSYHRINFDGIGVTLNLWVLIKTLSYVKRNSHLLREGNGKRFDGDSWYKTSQWRGIFITF